LIKNILTWALLVPLMTCTATAPVTASSYQEIADATYRLWAKDAPVCSGQFVEENTLLTAAHCVRSDGPFYLVLPTMDENEKLLSEQVVYLKVAKKHESGDTATLTVLDPSLTFPTVDVANKETVDELLVMGKDVLAAGYAFVDAWQLSEGIYSGNVHTTRAGDFAHMTDWYYNTTASIAGGMSGGGLYIEVVTCDADRTCETGWQLVGAVTGYAPAYAGKNVFSTIDSVMKVVD
jgi:hypothetical protein